MVTISVVASDWGEARQDDIRVLLEDAVSHIDRELRQPFAETVRVLNLPQQRNPRAFYRHRGEGAFDVNLTARDRRWSRFAYQFAHEFCHVLSGHERLRDNPNNWFHEAVCETASLFVLRRMGERWPTHPPYSNWASYSASLTAYADACIKRFRRNDPVEPLNDWLSAHEDEMRADPYRRDRNAIVALRLLPTFEDQPHGWNAVARLPANDQRLGNYLEAWWTCVDGTDRSFVENIRQRLLPSGIAAVC